MADLLSAMNLTPFTYLRSLSWRGINEGNHFWPLREFIKENRRVLESLEILTSDLRDWWRAGKCFYNY